MISSITLVSLLFSGYHDAAAFTTTTHWKRPPLLRQQRYSDRQQRGIDKTRQYGNQPFVYRTSDGAPLVHLSALPADHDDPTNDDATTIQRRPEWACDWMPTWLITMRPIVQLLVGSVMYVFHLKVLTQHMIAFPFQLFPNNRGNFQSIGLDSLAGILSLLLAMYMRRSTRHKPTPALPPLWRGPNRKEAPWRLPRKVLNTVRMQSKKKTALRTRLASTTNKIRRRKTKHNNKEESSSAGQKRFWNRKASKAARELPGPKGTSVVAVFMLVRTYFYSGLFGVLWEDALYAAAGMGFTMTKAMHRSLCVLLGHLTWIFFGGLILKLIPKPQPFFGGGYESIDTDADDNSQKKRKTRYKWFTSKWDTYWLWWTMGGYFVSSWLYNVSDFINQSVLPESLFDVPEGVVYQLINPENNDLSASLVGFVAPCLTAPWWEEVLYRGFLLPTMCLFMPYWASVFCSGIVFSVHHQSAVSAIPLAFLGWIWAIIYTKSGNLLVTILIHAMWNSRVFVGSWLGL